MDSYRIERTESTPLIEFDPERGVLRLEGESYPENALAFFAPLFEKLRTHSPCPGETLRVQIDLIYFNSSSSKCLMDLIEILNTRTRSGERISLQWHHEVEDEDMQEAGQEFAEDAEFVFHIIPNRAGEHE